MTLDRREFIKYTLGLGAAAAVVGLNPLKSEATHFPEGKLEGNTFIANDGTEIDVTHLGKKEWNPHQKRVLEKSAEEWGEAGYSDIGHLYETLRNRFENDKELGPLIPAMNLALHIGSSKEDWYYEYKSLFEEHKDYMIALADESPNNPVILTETGASYDTIDVLTEGPHIKYFEDTIMLLRQLPMELLYQQGQEGLINTNKDILKESAYANPIRGPPYKPITWNHEINIRGPPYDTAKSFLEMALGDYPNNQDFKNDYRWVMKHL